MPRSPASPSGWRRRAARSPRARQRDLEPRGRWATWRPRGRPSSAAGPGLQSPRCPGRAGACGRLAAGAGDVRADARGAIGTRWGWEGAGLGSQRGLASLGGRLKAGGNVRRRPLPAGAGVGFGPTRGARDPGKMEVPPWATARARGKVAAHRASISGCPGATVNRVPGGKCAEGRRGQSLQAPRLGRPPLGALRPASSTVCKQ